MDAEDFVETCHQNRVNIDIVTGYSDDGKFQCGIRLRPWKQPGKGVMVIALGEGLFGGLSKACKMAEAGRWEPLDYAKRPWAQQDNTAKTGWGPE